MKLQFGACPKCQGDLQVKQDVYGMFISCLQCGLQKDLDLDRTGDPASASEVRMAHVVASIEEEQDLVMAA